MSSNVDSYLRQACFVGNLLSAQQFRAEGGNISAPDGVGYTPLLLALKNSHVAVARWLLSVGADVKADFAMNECVLHAASKIDDPRLLQAVLDAGADADKRSADDRTALHTAASANAAKSLCVHLGAGLSLESVDESGMTPLHVAALTPGDGSQAFVAAAIANGANVLAKDKSLRTPLHHASLRNNRPVCELLVAAGADVNALDAGSKRPMDLTTNWGIQLHLQSRGGFASKKGAPPTPDEMMNAAAMTGQADHLLELMQRHQALADAGRAEHLIELARPLGHENVMAAMRALQAQRQIAGLRDQHCSARPTSS